MTLPTFFYTIEQSAEAVYKERGSDFIAYAFPMSKEADCKDKLTVLKKQHPKAVHYCFAYRIGTSGNRFRLSDDGEPSGTAGKPIMGQLVSREITNAGVIVVRYFGGTLLGVPGLIQAYKTATALVLQTVPILQKWLAVSYQLHFDYRFMNAVMHLIKQLEGEVLEQEMQLFCVWKITIPAKQEAVFLHRMRDYHQVQLIKETESL
ncbi:MAG: YigZ family protein [Chitinophagia bacterium]|jgi:uncharacterized YigZ family protein